MNDHSWELTGGDVIFREGAKYFDSFTDKLFLADKLISKYATTWWAHCRVTNGRVWLGFKYPMDCRFISNCLCCVVQLQSVVCLLWFCDEWWKKDHCWPKSTMSHWIDSMKQFHLDLALTDLLSFLNVNKDIAQQTVSADTDASQHAFYWRTKSDQVLKLFKAEVHSLAVLLKQLHFAWNSQIFSGPERKRTCEQDSPA